MTVLVFLPRDHIYRRIQKSLAAAHLEVETAESAKECVQLAQSKSFEGIIADIESLLFKNALTLVTFLRAENPQAALYVIAHNLDLDQRLHLFEAGVDDCVSGPFLASELTVRLHHRIRLRQAISDFAGVNESSFLRCGELELDLNRRRVVRRGKVIDLRPKEFLLLEYLARNVNRPVTRTMILEQVWGSSFEGLTNVVDVYINALRNKIDRDFSQKMIQTNRGIGYTLVSSP